MYVTRPQSDVIALDAETGRALWTYEHKLPGRVYVCCGEVNRGLAILGTTLFLTTLDAQLIALDARSGRVLWKKALADPGLNYTATGAPLAIKDKVIVGIAGAEGGIRGFLDAYDAKTGERRLAFLDRARAGRAGLGDMGRRLVEARRSVDVADRLLRSGAEPHLLGHRQSGPGLQRRRPPWRQPVFVLAARAGSGHRQAEMAFPVHAARHARLGRDADPGADRLAAADGRKLVVVPKPQRLPLRARPADRRVPARQAVRASRPGRKRSTRRAGR